MSRTKLKIDKDDALIVKESLELDRNIMKLSLLEYLMIQSYFNRVCNRLKKISPLIQTDTSTFEIVSADMGILRGRIIFIDGSALDF